MSEVHFGLAKYTKFFLQIETAVVLSNTMNMQREAEARQLEVVDMIETFSVVPDSEEASTVSNSAFRKMHTNCYTDKQTVFLLLQ
jgi:hypothetical protein